MDEHHSTMLTTHQKPIARHRWWTAPFSHTQTRPARVKMTNQLLEPIIWSSTKLLSRKKKLKCWSKIGAQKKKITTCNEKSTVIHFPQSQHLDIREYTNSMSPLFFFFLYFSRFSHATGCLFARKDVKVQWLNDSMTHSTIDGSTNLSLYTDEN